MAEENSGSTGGFQISQQTQGNANQSGDNFQLDFGDNGVGNSSIGVDVDVSLGEENKQEDSGFNADLSFDKVNIETVDQESSENVIEPDGISSENLDVSGASVGVDSEIQDTNEEQLGNNEESMEITNINLESEPDRMEEINFDKGLDDNVLDAPLENNSVSNPFDDGLSDSVQGEEVDEHNPSLDTKGTITENSQESDDLLSFEDDIMDKENGDVVDNNINDMGENNSEEVNLGDSEEVNLGDSEEVNLGDTEEVNSGDSEEVNLGDSEEVNLGDGEEVNSGDSEEVNLGDSEEVNLGDGEEVNLGDSEEVNLGDSEEVNLGDSEEVNLGDSEEVNLGDSEEVNLGDSEEVNLGDSEEVNLGDSEEVNLGDSEEVNLGDSGEILDIQSEGAIEKDEDNSLNQNTEGIVSESNNFDLGNDEKTVVGVEGVVDNNLEGSFENVESDKLSDDSSENIEENLESAGNADNLGFSEDVMEDNPLNGANQDDIDKESIGFSLDFPGDSEGNLESVENEQGNNSLNGDEVVSDDSFEIGFSDDGENGVATAVNDELSMEGDMNSSNDSLNESIQIDNDLPDVAEVDDTVSNQTTNMADEIQESNNIDEYPLSNDTVNDSQKVEGTVTAEENSELFDGNPNTDVTQSVDNNVQPNAQPNVQPNVQQEGLNVAALLDENNGLTSESVTGQSINDVQNKLMTNPNLEENQIDNQNFGTEVDQNSALSQNSYKTDMINENQTNENQTGEAMKENTNINMQATLSLDEILDSELSTNPQFADNSKAVPENVQVGSSGLFSNKKMLGIVAGVGIFLLAGFVIVLAFPFNNPNRPSGEVVVNPVTDVETRIDAEWPDVDDDEHGSATALVDEQESGFNDDEDLDNNSENPIDNKVGNPTSVVVFPDVEGDDEGDDEWDDEGDIEEPVPYVSDSEDVVEDLDSDEQNEISLDEIKKIISSFKNEAESYYSYGQEVSDNNIMKYSRQVIYLCDSYQQKIDNGEGLDEKSVADFTSQIDEKLSKIEMGMNGGEEEIVTTVESFEHDSDYEELKAYIENR